MSCRGNDQSSGTYFDRTYMIKKNMNETGRPLTYADAGLASTCGLAPLSFCLRFAELADACRMRFFSEEGGGGGGGGEDPEP